MTAYFRALFQQSERSGKRRLYILILLLAFGVLCRLITYSQPILAGIENTVNPVLYLLHIPTINLEQYERVSSKSRYGKWAQAQAETALKKYEETGIHREDIEGVIAETKKIVQRFKANGPEKENNSNRQYIQFLPLLRIQIKDGKIYASEENRDQPFYHDLIQALKITMEHYPIQDLDVIIDVGDGTPRRCYERHCNIPVFVNTRYVWDQESVLIPDALTITRFPKLYQQIKRYKLQLPWNKKLPMMYWRGDISGPYDWTKMADTISTQEMATIGKDFARGHLVRYARTYPHDINASFNGGLDNPDNFHRSSIQQQKFIDYYGIPAHHYFPMSEFLYHHLQYKWLPCIDGHVSTYPGFLWRLASNSLVIKQDSDRIQWFYSIFKPFEDYVPIDRNLGNMESILVWLKHHDAEEQRIVQHANRTQQRYLTPSKIMYYLATLLNHYASLQRFPVEVTYPPAEEANTPK